MMAVKQALAQSSRIKPRDGSLLKSTGNQICNPFYYICSHNYLPIR